MADWQWVLGVNLWGVIHGVRAFAPIMLAQDSEGYIVNIASIAGVISYHPSAPYEVTKHAVVALSENLYHSLGLYRSKIGVSVVCPGWVKTRIMDSERNRPLELRNDPADVVLRPEALAVAESMRQACLNGIPPKQVADAIFDAMREKRFYVFTHPEMKPLAESRAADLVEERNPASVMAPP